MIGLMDSGIGGLSCLRALSSRFLNHDFVYFADLANLPYGSKSPRTIQHLSIRACQQVIERLQSGDRLLIACNTASAVAFSDLKALCVTKGIECHNVLSPTCRALITAHAEDALILATPATAAGGYYRKELQRLNFKGKIHELACPLFVPLVEECIFEGPALDWILERYLSPYKDRFSHVVLGCTHYPYLKKSLTKFLGDVFFYEAGATVALEMGSSTNKNRKEASHVNFLFSDDNFSNEKIECYLQAMELTDLSYSTEVIKATST